MGAAAAHYQTQEKKYVYGIGGIAKLFGCSIPTANRIKKSGKIDKSHYADRTQDYRRCGMALELAGKKNGGRR